MGSYRDGFRAATARDKSNLATSLRLQIEQALMDVQTARDVFADVFGVMEAEKEFGPDSRWACIE